MKKFLLIAFFYLSLNACDAPSLSSQVCGLYKAEYSYGTETLLLKVNGLYAQTFIFKIDSAPIRNKGAWLIDTAHHQIELKNGLIFDDGFGQPLIKPESGDSFLPIHSFLGLIQLSTNPDLDSPFNKISNAGCEVE